MPRRPPTIPPLLAAILVLAIAGCTKQLMPTPNVYVDPGDGSAYTLFEDPASARRTNVVDLLYITDRAPQTRRDGRPGYGWERSRSLAYGSCVVEIGPSVDWETLAANSTSRRRTTALPVRVRSITELGRLPDTPTPLVEVNGTLVEDPAVESERAAVAAAFEAEIRRRLADCATRVVTVYVHGFNNTFEYAAAILAEFTHFAGRENLNILYTWPSGSPGLLQGYNHDRESGEFTVYHLKDFIRGLADIPEIEGINIVAHSRGTDVAMTALRELLIEERGAGRDPRATLRIGEVVLASPDLDLEVMTQRFSGERLHRIAHRLTAYVSAEDDALGLSEWLFASGRRLGKLRPEDLTEEDRAMLAQIGSIDIIDCRVRTGSLGHSYYHSSPAVSSDLLLLLRYGADAGSPERPLREAVPGYWILDDEDYPFVGDE